MTQARLKRVKSKAHLDVDFQDWSHQTCRMSVFLAQKFEPRTYKCPNLSQKYISLIFYMDNSAISVTFCNPVGCEGDSVKVSPLLFTRYKIQ